MYEKPMLLLSKLAKEQNPNANVILAGKHVSVNPLEPFEKSDAVDAVTVLECEPHISELIETLEKENPPENLPGVVYKTEETRIRRTKGYGIVEDLDWLPPPSYHLLAPHLDAITKWSNRASSQIDLTLRSSYGCVYRCAFCSLTEHFGKYRVRSAEKIKEDIEYARKTLPDTAVFTYFDDELITYDRTHLQNLAQVMEELDTKVWGTLTNVNVFNREIAENLSKICSMVLFGAENANNMVLKTMGKSVDLSKVVKACEVTREYSMDPLLFWMVGLPGETKRVMVENLNTMHSLILKGYAQYIMPFILVPFPGSDIYGNPQKYGVTIYHERWEEYDEEGGYPTYRTRELSREEIYLYYLWSQMTINEASSYRPVYENLALDWKPLPGDPELFEQFMDSPKRDNTTSKDLKCVTNYTKPTKRKEEYKR